MRICKKCGARVRDVQVKCQCCGELLPAPSGETEYDKALAKVEKMETIKRYKITIEEEQVEETLTSAGWTAIDTIDGDSKFGNPPQVLQKEKVNRTIFTQNTDDLDLIAVIKAVNGIA